MDGGKRAFWFLIWCSALVIVWSLGRSYAVTKAMLLFFAAGVVPGTHIVLTPNQVLLLMGGLFGLSTLLIFSREIAMLFRRKSRAPQPTVPAPQAVEPELPEPVTVIPVHRGSGLAGFGSAMRTGLLRVALAVVAAVVICSEYVVRAWRWGEPHIRRFDRWIEMTLKRNPRIASVLGSFEGTPRPKPPQPGNGG
jgi:hypothetical protein